MLTTIYNNMNALSFEDDKNTIVQLVYRIDELKTKFVNKYLNINWSKLTISYCCLLPSDKFEVFFWGISWNFMKFCWCINKMNYLRSGIFLSTFLLMKNKNVKWWILVGRKSQKKILRIIYCLTFSHSAGKSPRRSIMI